MRFTSISRCDRASTPPEESRFWLYGAGMRSPPSLLCQQNFT
ncbi:hypothetical protein [Allocoleopsis sp.]